MKRWFRSKTLWVNAAIIAAAYWFQRSSFYVDPMLFVWAIAGVNIGLRFATSRRLTP